MEPKATEGQQPSQTGLPAEASVLTNASRRRFLVGGLAVGVPVIMTLSSRSALAHQADCTISGTLSGNLSRPQEHCEGCDAHTWCTNTGSWPSGYSCGTYNWYTNNQSDWSWCSSSQLNYLKQHKGQSYCNQYFGYSCNATLYNHAVFNSGPATCTQSDFYANNCPLSLQQALCSTNTTEQTYAACILNAAKWGSSFGYTLSQMQQLIAANNGKPGFVTSLQKLFNRS